MVTSDDLTAPSGARGSMDIVSRARAERTRDALRSLLAGVGTWMEYRKSEDAKEERHRSQLEAIGSCLRGALEALSKGHESVERVASGSGSARSVEVVFQSCRGAEQRIAWLSRLFWYFRERFDQRDDRGAPLVAGAAELLALADDVVWSCYAPILENARFEGLVPEVRSPPLPFFDAEVSLSATPATWVPNALYRDSGEELAAHLAKLPFSVVHLPPEVAYAPWWMTFVGHEVGHCVQMELRWEAAFSDVLRAVVTPKDAGAWSAWSREVFADQVGCATMGPELVRALAESVRAPWPSMRRRESYYPPSAVRLALCAAMLRKNGCGELDVEWALGGLRPEEIVKGDPVAERDLAQVEAVVDALSMPLDAGSGKGFRDIVGPIAAGRVGGEEPPEPSAPVALTAARDIVRWSFGAWMSAESLAEPQERAEARKEVSEATRRALSKAHVPGSRAGHGTTDASSFGAALVGLLAGEEESA